jgi:hypothetical protein
MSEDYFQQQPIATWNPARGVWETGGGNLFCEHLEPFSETWPISGTTQDGKVFALRTQAHPITVSESLLLRSPKASEGQGGALGEAEALRRGNTVGVRDQIMDLVRGQGLKVSRQADNLLPTPSVAHLRNHDEDIDGYLERRQDFVDGKTLGMSGASLGVAVRMQVEGIELLPTVTAQDGKNNGGPSQAVRNTPPSTP